MLYDSLTTAEIERELERIEYSLDNLWRKELKPELEFELKRLAEQLRQRLHVRVWTGIS